MIQATYIEEPDLIFGQKHEEKDPKLGLMHFGPYIPSDSKKSFQTHIRVGIVGNSISITLAKKILELLDKPINSEETNRWLYPDYPGFRLDNKIQCGFTSSDIWNETITEYEIRNVLEIIDVNERIAAASDLFINKIEKITFEDSPPHVIICSIPKEIEDYCGISEKTRGAKRPKFTKLEKHVEEMKKEGQTFLSRWGVEIHEELKHSISYDFRNALKGKVMKFNIPTQLLRETTAKSILEYPHAKGTIKQNPATFAWNFSTGLYYKALGRPWRLAKLTSGTCYVGISFYRNLLTPTSNLETAMAQVFTHTGEGFVLRGSDVIIDRQTRQPHLTTTQAKELLLDSIEKYTNKVNTKPNRVVIHKSSFFSDEEIKGFDEAIGEIPRDYVAISKNTDFRFLRTGIYPVLRGTLISLSDNEHLLYSTGYTPRVRTYPGLRIPRPLLVRHIGDSEIKLICSEILGLTKLNWNTTAFSTQLPITLEFARRVGKVLSEIPRDVKLQDHYRFYM
jgi:hypothetical protein